MTSFTSSREKKLWMMVLTVVSTIFSILLIGKPLTHLWQNQDVQAAIFVIVMVLIATIIIIHAFYRDTSKYELIIRIGLAAVFIMLFLRLGLPERSHLMEYSVLAIFIHMALMERSKNDSRISTPALWAFLLAFLIGIIDECIQIFLPDRVFDFNDIFFNGFATGMAIGARKIIYFVQKTKSRVS